MDREKTNSVTKLVKIIAQEVVDENIQCIKKNNESRCQDYNNLSDRVSYLENIIRPLKNAPCGGEFWSDEDHERLTRNFNQFNILMAKRFGRTPLAIKCRIKNYLKVNL
jgi:hypothetical protein